MVEVIDLTDDRELIPLLVELGVYPKWAIKHVKSVKLVSTLMGGKKVGEVIVEFDNKFKANKTIIVK